MTRYRFTVEADIDEARLSSQRAISSFPLPEDPHAWMLADLGDAIDADVVNGDSATLATIEVES